MVTTWTRTVDGRYSAISLDWRANCPKLGYTYGSDTLPIIEYYGFFKPEEGTHEYCYLYVPVKGNNAMAK